MLAMNSADWVWGVFVLVNGGLMVTASAILMKGRPPGTLAMLLGSILFLLNGLFVRVFWILQFSKGPSGGLPSHTVGRILSISHAIGLLGAGLFGAGLVFYALRRRSLAARIRQLESILESRNSA